MIVSLKEIYEKTQVGRASTAPHQKAYELRDVFINPEHVVCLRSADEFPRLLVEGMTGPGIDAQGAFTRVFLNRGNSGINLVVTGTPDEVQRVISPSTVLKG